MYLIDYALLHGKGDKSLETKLGEYFLSDSSKKTKIVSAFMTNGVEFRRMKKEVRRVSKKYGKKICFTKPVLCGKANLEKLADILIDEYEFNPDDRFYLMGHGKDHSLNRSYLKLEKILKKKLKFKYSQPVDNISVYMLKGKHSIFEEKLNSGAFGAGKLHIVPLFINCAHHVKKDIFGNEQESVLSLLATKKDKNEIALHQKGLSEIKAFREVFFYEREFSFT